MGNSSCVATGGAPHQVTIKVINLSGGTIELDPSRTCDCGEGHGGFNAKHGKFNGSPFASMDTGLECIFRVSGREASAVCPEGWVQYRWRLDNNIKLRIEYNAAGWTDLQNRSFVSAAIVQSTKKYGVEVITINDWSYEIKLAPVKVISTTSASGGLHAENRIKGFFGDKSFVSHPEQMATSVRVSTSEIPSIANSFPCVASSDAFLSALDVKSGGQVVTNGYSCGGVAIQRAWFLLTRRCSSKAAIKVGKSWDCGGCIATDLIQHCKNVLSSPC